MLPNNEEHDLAEYTVGFWVEGAWHKAVACRADRTMVVAVGSLSMRWRLALFDQIATEGVWEFRTATGSGLSEHWLFSHDPP